MKVRTIVGSGILVLIVLVSLVFCFWQESTLRAPPTMPALEAERLDPRFRTFLVNLLRDEPARGCIYEMYLSPMSFRESLLGLRRIPYSDEYLRAHRPLAAFNLDDHLVFVHSGIDMYLKKSHTIDLRQPQGSWSDYPDFFRLYVDSAGSFHEIKETSIYLGFPLIPRRIQEDTTSMGSASESR